MLKIMRLLFILQVSVISVAPANASQSIPLAHTVAISKTATDELLEVVQRKETTSDDIITLIDKGADVNATNDAGDTPLTLAARNGHRDVCLTLISKGANVNAANDFGNTPLFLAASGGLADVCLTLINNGANINAKTHFCYTPLIVAAAKGHADVCIVLLRHILLKQLLATHLEGGNLATRKMRMRYAIMMLKRTKISKDLITLIIKSKPLRRDYTACRYDTYCCRFRLNEYHHAITRDQLYDLLGQGNIDALKAAIQQAYDSCGQTVLKNLLNPVNFDQHFDELFLKYLPEKPTTGE